MNAKNNFDPAQGILPIGSIHPTCVGSFIYGSAA